MKTDESIANSATDDTSIELPPFDPATAKFYDRLLAPNSFGIVAAVTGKFKTGLLCNLAAHTLLRGLPIAFVCLDMPWQDILRRLLTILSNVPVAQVDDLVAAWHTETNSPVQGYIPTLKTAIQFITPYDYTIGNGTPAQLAVDLPIIAGKVAAVFVDGLDAVAWQAGRGFDIDAVMQVLNKISLTYPIPVWTTSQCRRESEGKEIIELHDLAYTFGKAERPPLVVGLGPREEGRLWTACVTKDRTRAVVDNREVFRFVLRPSLRFEILPQVDWKPVSPAYSDAPLKCEFLGPSSDLPESDLSDDFNETDGAVPYSPSMRLYHGADGYVPKGRAIYSGPMFQNRNYKYCYWIDDLYQMAQFENATLYAPATHIPVKLSRGQLLTSLRQLEKRWDCSTKSVRSFLKCAANEQLIRVRHIIEDGSLENDAETSGGTSKVTRKRAYGSVITLCHYAGKPAKGRSSNRTNGHDDGHDLRHNEGTTQTQQRLTTEET